MIRIFTAGIVLSLLSLSINSLYAQARFDPVNTSDIYLPYRGVLKTENLDANNILKTGWSSDGIGDYLQFYVPGNDPGNAKRQSNVPRLMLSEDGDLFVRYHTSIKVLGDTRHNLILTSGFADDIGHHIKFWVPIAGRTDPPTSKLVIAGNGNVGIGLHPQSRLHVDGTTRTKVLTITGGSDLSENFNINLNSGEVDTVEPGMLVCIDHEIPGELIVCENAYDKTVAGIVSGAGGLKPGVLMGQEDSVANGTVPVSLSGRVYAMADASYGKIKPGDQLTTSKTPGHAMGIFDQEKAQGAIIGKAMSSLDAGQGLVLVLVTLQ